MSLREQLFDAAGVQCIWAEQAAAVEEQVPQQEQRYRGDCFGRDGIKLLVRESVVYQPEQPDADHLASVVPDQPWPEVEPLF